MKKANELKVKGTAVRVVKIGGQDFVCLTDMAKLKSEDPSFTINHWMRNRMTIEYLGLWESLYNPNFKPTEFGRFNGESQRGDDRRRHLPTPAAETPERNRHSSDESPCLRSRQPESAEMNSMRQISRRFRESGMKYER